MADTKGNKTARRQAYYKSQPGRTESNQRKKLIRHIRHFPQDMQSRLRCSEKYGEAVEHGAVASIVASARRKLAA